MVVTWLQMKRNPLVALILLTHFKFMGTMKEQDEPGIFFFFLSNVNFDQPSSFNIKTFKNTEPWLPLGEMIATRPQCL